MPELDLGTSTTAGVRCDHQVKPGEDDEQGNRVNVRVAWCRPNCRRPSEIARNVQQTAQAAQQVTT